MIEELEVPTDTTTLSEDFPIELLLLLASQLDYNVPNKPDGGKYFCTQAIANGVYASTGDQYLASVGVVGNQWFVTIEETKDLYKAGSSKPVRRWRVPAESLRRLRVTFTDVETL